MSHAEAASNIPAKKGCLGVFLLATVAGVSAHLFL
jgi:hypothetical protein